MHPETPTQTAARLLIVKAGAHLSGLPLGTVVETMRPLPVRPVAGAPAGLLGVARIRGEIVPIVDLAQIVESVTGSVTRRFVVVRAGERRVALAVESVLSIADESRFTALPALLGPARNAGVAAIAQLDRDLLLVLEASRLVPQEAWDAVTQGAP
jgi:purine-binding chemotaxis protein CheW